MLHHPLNSDTALQLINTWHSKATGECLKDILCEVFRGCWEGLTYTKIAARTNHDHDYVRELGAELFKKLTALLDRPVSKSTLKTTVEHYILSLNDSPPSNDSSGFSLVLPEPIGPLDLPSNPPIVDPSFFGRDEEIAQIDRLWKQDRSLSPTLKFWAQAMFATARNASKIRLFFIFILKNCLCEKRYY